MGFSDPVHITQHVLHLTGVCSCTTQGDVLRTLLRLAMSPPFAPRVISSLKI